MRVARTKESEYESGRFRKTGAANFSSWLYTIARNVRNDELRRLKAPIPHEEEREEQGVPYGSQKSTFVGVQSIEGYYNDEGEPGELQVQDPRSSPQAQDQKQMARAFQRKLLEMLLRNPRVTPRRMAAFAGVSLCQINGDSVAQLMGTTRQDVDKAVHEVKRLLRAARGHFQTLVDQEIAHEIWLEVSAEYLVNFIEAFFEALWEYRQPKKGKEAFEALKRDVLTCGTKEAALGCFMTQFDQVCPGCEPTVKQLVESLAQDVVCQWQQPGERIC